MNELTTTFLWYYLMLGPSAGKSELGLATYKYSGMEHALQVYSETYPKDLRVAIANSIIIGSAISNRYLTYTWSF